MPTVWTDTFLHSVESFGGVQDMGAGSFGATQWTPLADNPVVAWMNTYLHAVGSYGGVVDMGAGSFGATEWEIST